MRILYITRAYSLSPGLPAEASRAKVGGMERLSYELARELQRVPDTEVDLIAHTGSRRTSPLFIVTCLPRAIRLARRADFILLGDPLLSFAGWVLNKIFTKPIAVIVHGLDISYRNALYQAYLRLFFSAFQLYLPISHHVNTLLDQKGITGNRAVVTPGIHDYFYDSSINRNQLAQLLQTTNYKLKTNDIVLLTVGRLVERKGHAWFIGQVMPHLPSIVQYVIAGAGPQEAAIRRTAAAHKLSSRVHLLGRVSDKQLIILYNTVDAYVQPNIPIENDVEGFGLVLLEAALCNRPVFAANLEGIPAAIQHGQNGLLLPPQDAQAWINALRRLMDGTLPLPDNPRQFSLEKYAWPAAAGRYRAALTHCRSQP